MTFLLPGEAMPLCVFIGHLHFLFCRFTCCVHGQWCIKLLFFLNYFADLLKHILDKNSFCVTFGDSIFSHPLFAFCSIHVLNFDLVHLYHSVL